MTDQPFSAPAGSYVPATEAPLLAQWLAQRADVTADKPRLPAVIAAQRIALADGRCQRLNQHIEEVRTRLLNLPVSFSYADRIGLEERLLKLEEQLHRERLALWKDLGPLLMTARDASVESMRSMFLDQLIRQSSSGMGDRS